MVTEDPSGDLLDRCTFEIRAGDEALGTGVLVAPDKVLTCSHVVEGYDGVEIYDADGEKLADATVEKRGNPKGPDDLALLELKAPLPGRISIRFEKWTRDERFSTTGFPEGGKGHANGHIQGRAKLHRWLQFDATSWTGIEPGFSGAAVWAPEKKAAVGLVTHYVEQSAVAYAVPADQIAAFRSEPQATHVDDRSAGYEERVERLLRKTKIQRAIQEADPAGHWAVAASLNERWLARVLCRDTKPDKLAEGLAVACCALLDDDDIDHAEEVFEVLMEALPAAFLEHWDMEFPESSATTVEFELLSDELAEFALAATDGAGAVFRNKTEAGEDIPRPAYSLPRPGEVGADPHGSESAAEIAEALSVRLAVDGAGKEMDEFLAALATHQPTSRDLSILGPSHLQMIRNARQDPENPAGTILLKVIRRALAKPRPGQRRLYLVANQEMGETVRKLKRILPELRIVTLSASLDQLEKTQDLIDALRLTFLRRLQKEDA